MEDIAGSVLKLLNTWEQPEEPYMPDPAYVREKLQEYNIQWQEQNSMKNTYLLKYGLKAATKDIDVLLSTHEETAELIQGLLKSGYHIIQTDRLGVEYQEMLAAQILENEDGFRWDIFHEYDEVDLLLIARSKFDWEIVLKECMSQSREDLRCEVDLSDKLDKLGEAYGLETPIYGRISQAAQIRIEKWFEEQIIGELKISPKTTEDLLVRFKCGRETLIPSLVNLEKMGRIEKVNGKYILKK